jgi:hypothetical protein
MKIFDLRRIHKRATEKPIEIFVALFIILAVAMVMLKMFKGQVTEKSTELKELQRKSDLEQARVEIRTDCKALCSQSYEDGCTNKAKATFCLRKLENIDLDGDRSTTGVDKTLLGGIYVCEDGIYCPMAIECSCGAKLTMAECVKVLCDYWKELNLPTATRDDLLKKTYSRGTCVATTTGDKFWDEVMLGTSITSISAAACTGVGATT